MHAVDTPSSPRMPARRGAMVLLAAIAAGLALSAPARAETTIRFWHAMNGVLGEVLDAQVARFNASQKDYKVVATYKGTYEEVMQAGLAATGAQAPHVLQVFEVGTANMMARPRSVKPAFQLMADAKEKLDPRQFFPAVAAHFSDNKGKLYALPFNISTPVLFYNRDAFAKAGLDPDKPPRTWMELQAVAIKLTDSGATQCGITTGWQSWVHLENVAAWHNEPVATRDNGYTGLDAKLNFNGQLMIRHISLLSSWVKSGLFSYAGREEEAEARFLSGDCGLITTSSAAISAMNAKAKFAVGVGQLPYYDDFKGAPYNTLIGGAGLWAMGGHGAADYKGVAKLFAFLSRPEVEADWHERTGYLPVSRESLELSKKRGYFTRTPGALVPMQQLARKTDVFDKGIRLGNFLQIRHVVDEELEHVWTGKKTPKEALDEAVERGNVLLRRFERTQK